MTDTLSDELKQQIVLTAATIAGKGATPAAVAKEVEQIAGYLNPNSVVQRAFANIEKQASLTVKSSGFQGTIIGFAKEVSSNRGVVMFRTSETTHTPEAKKFLRTAILDNGGPITELMNQIKGDAASGVESLVGHKVFVAFDLVKKGDNSGHTVRVLNSVTDRGADPDYDFSKPEYQPVFYTDAAKARSMEKVSFFPKVPALVGA